MQMAFSIQKMLSKRICNCSAAKAFTVLTCIRFVDAWQSRSHRTERLPGVSPAKTSNVPKQTTGFCPKRLLVASKTLLQNVILFMQAGILLCKSRIELHHLQQSSTLFILCGYNSEHKMQIILHLKCAICCRLILTFAQIQKDVNMKLNNLDRQAQ